MADRSVEGPWFEDLEVGQIFDRAPSVTLTDGLAVQHRAIVGGRTALCLDNELARIVTGRGELAPSALVWDLSIGQSTVATHHVRANLFYRGLRFRSTPAIGDTLRTVTEVVGLKQNSARPDRPATGLAALRIRTSDVLTGAEVLDFYRCAMIPLRDQSVATGHEDDLSRIGIDEAVGPLPGADWDLAALGERAGTVAGTTSGTSIEVVGGDVVSSAPELARITLNIAAVHHDRFRAGGERLVYGGHTIGLTLHQVGRAFPSLATVVAWEGCDHLAPVHEGDTLSTVVHVNGVRPTGSGFLLDLRAQVTARAVGGNSTEVLDWRFTVLAA